jgi:CRP/FNR family transcriptional regulator
VGAIPLVLSGRVRVSKTGDSGRVITIYHFGAGECCVLAANAVMGDRTFPASARVEEAAEVVLIPGALFNDWLATVPPWRSYVLDAMSHRLVSLLDTLEKVAFTRLDARVAALVVARAGRKPGDVRITHQAIADELGSSREVVSRILGGLQDQGLVRLKRGAIEVLAPALSAV